MSQKGFTTAILHRETLQIEDGEPHRRISTSVAPGYDDVHDLIAIFQGKPGNVYARQSATTTTALEQQITTMEGGVATAVFASGMAAIGSVFFALLRAGDHLVSSKDLFGNTDSQLKTFQRFGVKVSFIDATDARNVERALTPETRMVFVETVANPRTQIADLVRIGNVCRSRGILYIVDNTITTPYLFSPKSVGASLVINSLTKGIAGHGAALGGAATDTGLFDWTKYPIDERYKSDDPSGWGIKQIRKLGLRDFGSTLSPEAAHHIALGAETLALRMERTCHNTRQLTMYLAAHPKVAHVYYPGLASHPQHKRAESLFKNGPGGLFSFELAKEIDHLKFLNRLQVVIKSSNLGDTRTLAIPVAQTIYHEMGAERRASMGIADSLIRISVGIEGTGDLIEDFKQALAAC
ncbi:MAG: cystathionine gamma-synthase family protein [bacterium]|nr:cystathionine gamma-synthase family protein [bacterium]